MAKMKAKEIRRQKILNDLLNQECCTYEYLMTNYGISERSMQMDINELCKQGYKIKGSKAKRGYVLTKEKESPIGYFEASDAQKIRKLFLLQILQNSRNGHTIKELVQLLQQYNYDNVEEDVKNIQNEKTIATALEELVDARMVAVENGRYVIATYAPLQLPFTTSDTAIQLLELLETCSEGHYHEKVLEEIKEKLAITLFNEPEEERDVPSNYVVYRKSYETSFQLEALLKELNQYPFEEKVLRITYKNRQGEVNTIPYSVGNVVYSVDKDELYLLGEYEGTRWIILYDTILKIEVTGEENKIFQNEFFIEIVKDMFSISVEDVQKVKVEFDHIFGIKDKLLRLLNNRPKARLYEENGMLYYEDSISGMNDFAGYLRRYGYACRVLQPPCLQKLMRDSAMRILENYKCLEEELKKQ